MGILDKKQYLTGKSGIVEAGDTIWIHSVRKGFTGSNGPEVQLTVSREQDSTKRVVYVGGNLATQASDTEGDTFPMHVRIGQVDTGKENPAFTFEDPNKSTNTDDDIPF